MRRAQWFLMSLPIPRDFERCGLVCVWLRLKGVLLEGWKVENLGNDRLPLGLRRWRGVINLLPTWEETGCDGLVSGVFGN